MTRLTPHQLDVLWHGLELGRLPYPLDVPRTGAEPPGGRPDPRLAEQLRLLADHEVAVDAVAGAGGPIRAIAASNRRHAVLAVLRGDAVELTEIRPTALARSVVDVLPPKPAGPGGPRTLRLETLRQAVTRYEDSEIHDDDPWGNDELDERAALVKAGLSPEDAKAVSELAANRVAGGQFGVSCSDGGYRGKRSPVLVNWFDTHQGRYLMVCDDQWLSIAPADNDRIAARIASVLSTVTTDHDRLASLL